MVVVGKLSGAAEQARIEFTQCLFGTTSSEPLHLKAWLEEHAVADIGMESMAQCWKPVWLARAKGNVYLRRVLSQAAQASKTQGSYSQARFNRLLPRPGHVKAIWAIARNLSVVIWKILHGTIQYVERRQLTTPQAAKRRLRRLKRELRIPGYSGDLKPVHAGALS